MPTEKSDQVQNAILIATAAFEVLDRLLPLIERMASEGQISPEVQASVKEKVNAILSGERFNNPPWT